MRKRSYEVDYNESIIITDHLGSEHPTHVVIKSVIFRKSFCKTYMIARAFGAILIILSVLSVAFGRYNQSQMSSADRIKYEDAQAKIPAETTEETTITSSIETTFIPESQIATEVVSNDDTRQDPMVSDTTNTEEEIIDTTQVMPTETKFVSVSEITNGISSQLEGKI